MVVGVFALLAVPACAGYGGRECPPECTGETEDGGPELAIDAAVPGPPSPDGGPATDGGDGGGVSFDAEASRSDDACFNGADDDGDANADCADSSCGVAPYCCVGETRASCCQGAGQDVTLDFSTCAAGTPAECGAGTMFGTASPTIEDGALVPNGGAGSDAGVVIGGAIDATRERVVLEARLRGPADGCEGDGCVDAVLLGLAALPSGTSVRVQPDVAVMVRGSRGDSALVIAGEVVAEWGLTDSDAHRYQLELTPDGAVTLRIDDEAIATATYQPRSDRRAVLFGRNHDRTGEQAASGAVGVSVRTSTCDVPSALRRDADPVAPWADAMWSGLSVSSPSAVRTPTGETLLAIELPDGIGLLMTDAGGWSVVGDLRAPPVAPPVGERYEDPELVVEADRFVLYLTHQHADGARTIARAPGAAGFAPSFEAPVDVTLPDAALESPAVLDVGTTVDGSPRRLMAATLRDDEGTHVALLEATDAQGTSFDWAASEPVVDTGADFAFDDDEVGDPDLVVDDLGLVRLYYAGRRGTRWAIGMRVSGDTTHWRVPAGGGAIFGGSGRGFDALGVRDPSVSLDGGERTLFYTGTDGARFAVGRAVGRAP